MPAKDRYHDTVVRALIKDGWTITKEQVYFRVGRRKIYIDIRASKEVETLAVLVEVKGFENVDSDVEYLARAIGKYALYRTALAYAKVDTPLYMAVPTAAHAGILSERLGQLVLQRVDAKLIVFDPETAEITQWIPSLIS